MTKPSLIAIHLLVGILFLILFIRYGYLQLAGHSTLLKKSIHNYSSTMSIRPVRGVIIDKNSIILADNQVSYAVAAQSRYLKANLIDTLFESLSKYLNITALEKKKYLHKRRHNSSNEWIIIKDDLSNNEIANLTAHHYQFPQISVFARIKRHYPFSAIYSHSIGYIGHFNKHDKNKINFQYTDYMTNDHMGKTGLEQFYETELRGQLGKKTIKIDALGNEIGLIKNTPATDGHTLQLTIDHNLQRFAWNLLGKKKGVIIALNPETGGILAFVSKPGFDPNSLLDGISSVDWQYLVNDPDKPMLNRGTQGTYPPGSVFKPFLALAALYLGICTPDTTINDPGYFIIPGSTHKFRDSYPSGRGKINLAQAIAYSSDTFFYKLGLEIGIDNAGKVLSLFGFGHKTGVDLPHENPGLLPSKAFKAKRFRRHHYQKKWLAADSVVFGIGQGFNNYSPLQIAFATSIIANNGNAITPHFLDKIIGNNGQVLQKYMPQKRYLKIPTNYFIFIKQAMQKAVTHGTASRISSGLKYTLAGKTGTAQVVALNKHNRKASLQGKQYKEHAWFTAFAPVDKPKLVAVVLVENSGWGAAEAAPLARQLFDFYLLSSENTVTFKESYKKFSLMLP
jgi:penicillin-binding protein 2